MLKEYKRISQCVISTGLLKTYLKTILMLKNINLDKLYANEITISKATILIFNILYHAVYICLHSSPITKP